MTIIANLEESQAAGLVLSLHMPLPSVPRVDFGIHRLNPNGLRCSLRILNTYSRNWGSTCSQPSSGGRDRCRRCKLRVRRGVLHDAWESLAFGLGKTQDEVTARNPYGPAWMPFLLSFIGQVVMAILFASLLAHFDPAFRTISASIAAAFFLWLAFTFVPLLTNHAYGGSRPMLTLIDGAHWLGVMIIQALIIGRLGLTA